MRKETTMDDPMAPLSYAPEFTADDYEPGALDEVRFWRGMSGRIYAECNGWFDNPECTGPVGALEAWFFDGPMTWIEQLSGLQAKLWSDILRGYGEL